MSTLYHDPPSRMLLSEVLQGISVRAKRGPDVPVAGITDDSRAIRAGDLFVALTGRTVDGHRFVMAAAEAGASAVLASREVDFPGTLVVVEDTAMALGLAAANRYGNPGRHLGLLGLTGTNGKTTTTYILESILEAAGHRPGVIGTVSYRFAGQTRKAPFTTPTAPALQGLLSEMALAGSTHAVMEVSSHALWLQRVAGLEFDVAGFTNLTQDHLDLHGSMEAYQEAKRLLFVRHLKPSGAAVLWYDDPAAPAMVLGYPGRVVRVSRRDPEAEVKVEARRQTLEGIEAMLTLWGEAVEVHSPLVGDHNLQNIALAAAMAIEAGLGPEAIALGVERLAVVPGRLERVEPGNEVAVLVDYAHTPDALAHALSALRPLCAGRLICVFGCGGDWDALKRPLMGAAVARGADLAVVTSDNPRSENPLAILAAIVAGVAGEGLARIEPEALGGASAGYAVMPDRREAIYTAVQAAHPGDVVPVAGKGHEDYQILGAKRIHFDDREEKPCSSRYEEAPVNEPLRATCSLSLHEVGRAVGRDVPATVAGLTLGGVATDSRDVRIGDSLALRGAQHDGHCFLAAAVDRGAAALLLEDPEAAPPDVPVLQAPYTTVALGALARAWRRRLGSPLVAVTGSNGKTTTKEMLAAIFAVHAGSRESVLVTPGNWNNHVGLPLTLLRGTAAQRMGVVELGMNAPGEIASLTTIAEPQVGVITNAAAAHLERFGGAVDGVARAKAELWDHLGEKAVAVVNLDDPRLPALAAARQGPRLTFGQAEGADVRILGMEPIGTEGLRVRLALLGDPLDVQVPLLGRHNAWNAAAATAAAHALGVPPETVRAGLVQTRLPAHRAVVTSVGEVVVLDDCYNANPASVRAAAASLRDLAGGGRLGALLGELRELGPGAADLHRELGRHLAREGFAVLVGLGPLCEALCQGAREGGVRDVVNTQSVTEAASAASARFLPGDHVLVKGSRAMGMEAVIATWRQLAVGRGGT